MGKDFEKVSRGDLSGAEDLKYKILADEDAIDVEEKSEDEEEQVE